jgi:hypothetical protein
VGELIFKANYSLIDFFFSNLLLTFFFETGSWYVVQVALELMILWPQPPNQLVLRWSGLISQKKSYVERQQKVAQAPNRSRESGNIHCIILQFSDVLIPRRSSTDGK